GGGGGLQAAGGAAMAGLPLALDRQVTEFGRTAMGAAKEPPIRDDTAADARADGEIGNGCRSTRRAEERLCERGSIRVVVAEDRDAEGSSKRLRQRQVLDLRNRRCGEQSDAPAIGGTRQRYTDSAHGSHASFSERVPAQARE